jgi:hypothetical protein
MTREKLDGLTLFHCRFIRLAWMFIIVPVALRMAIDMVVSDGMLLLVSIGQRAAHIPHAAFGDCGGEWQAFLSVAFAGRGWGRVAVCVWVSVRGRSVRSGWL